MIKQAVYIIVTVGLVLLNTPVVAQDIHFSQYYATSLVLNPALTGVGTGDLRISTSYKDQWRSITNPYKTFFASADAKIVQGKLMNGILGIGFTAFSDKAGTANLGLSQFNFSLAYSSILNSFNTLSLGVQVGYAQKSANYELLKWDSQFNGQSYNASLPSGEALSEQVGYTDIAAGGLWGFKVSDVLKGNLGLAMFHLNKPDQSLSTLIPDSLNRKLVVHGSLDIKLGNSRYSILPSFLYLKQGKTAEIDLGTFLKYNLVETYTTSRLKNAVLFGVFYRLHDAIIPTIRLDCVNSLTLGISYDITLSRLYGASSARGGLEFSIIYTAFYNKKTNKSACPAWVN